MNKQYCFCTLALGKIYRNFTLLLAKDLEIHAPESELIVLTDDISYFTNQSNIRPFKHQPLSCKIYNDKRFAIAKALEFYPSCIFLDSNIRIKEQVPDEINFESGIVAYTCYNILKNFYKEGKSDPNHKQYKNLNNKFKLFQQVSLYYNLEPENIKFLFEGVFYVSKNDNFEEFIEYWAILADYFELNGIYNEEGIVIGLAAAIANISINYDRQKKIKIFKDVLEKRRISIGQSNYEENKDYFEALEKIEYPKLSLIEKGLKKINKKLGFYYRIIKLKIRVLKYQKLFSNFKQIPVTELKNISNLNSG